MHKKVLVCLPLSDAHRAALEASVPEFEFRFNALDDVHAEDVLWADVVLGNAPVSMLSQNKHIEWFRQESFRFRRLRKYVTGPILRLSVLYMELFVIAIPDSVCSAV